MESNWHKIWKERGRCAPFNAFDSVLMLSQFSQFPTIEQLNQLSLDRDEAAAVQFTSQHALDIADCDYESYIAKTGRVPTRTHNWHDLFNACIWLTMPKTKKILNQLHVEHIHRYGLNPRTARRNRITHFDECGVILAVSDCGIIEDLAQHHWSDAFIKNRSGWQKNTQALVFGHANLELLLEPFIGLTGKWLAVKVGTEFFDYDQANKFQHIDSVLSDRIINEGLFEQGQVLKPLPLLGVPGWWDANQHPEFYTNTDYFRPKR